MKMTYNERQQYEAALRRAADNLTRAYNIASDRDHLGEEEDLAGMAIHVRTMLSDSICVTSPVERSHTRPTKL